MEKEGDLSYAIRRKEGTVEFNMIDDDGNITTSVMTRMDAIQLAKNILNTIQPE